MNGRWKIFFGWLAVAAVLAAGPAVAQETVIGFLEEPAVNDCKPVNDNTCNPKPGVVRVSGWVLADSGVRRVVIQVDGVDVGQAAYGLSRPQVANQFPGFPDSEGAGFSYNVNGTDFANGVHEITAKVLTNDGTSTLIYAIDPDLTIHSDGIQEIFWSYNTAVLHPFGKINFPQRNAELYGTCCLRDFNGNCFDDPERPIRYTPVSGWALDLGKEIGDAGVGWAELLVDGSIYANTRTGCFFSPLTGGLSNCYGLPRLDIERRFPFAIDSPTSGFRFVLDVGALLVNGFAQGHHTLTIRVGDISTQNANVHEIPVNFLCIENLGNEEAFGRIGSPRPGRPYAGLVTFAGWALDGEGVGTVDLYVDGNFIGEAAYGPGQGTNPTVLAQYPGFPDSAAPVWRLVDYDTENLSDGFHQMQVVVTDRSVEADQTVIGEVTFFVDNEID